MDLRTELRYDANVERVFAMLCDEDFRKQVCEETMATSYDVSISTAGGDPASVRISRLMPAPDLAKKFVGDTLEIVQVEEWGTPAGGSRRASLAIDIPGKPASMRGAITLAPSGGGSVESISGDIKVKIPLVGGMLEKEIAKGLLAAIKQEGRVGRRWLSS